MRIDNAPIYPRSFRGIFCSKKINTKLSGSIEHRGTEAQRSKALRKSGSATARRRRSYLPHQNCSVSPYLCGLIPSLAIIWLLLSSGCFDLDIHASRKTQLVECFDCLGRRLHNIDQTFVRPNLKLLSCLLINVRAGEHRIALRSAWAEESGREPRSWFAWRYRRFLARSDRVPNGRKLPFGCELSRASGLPRFSSPNVPTRCRQTALNAKNRPTSSPYSAVCPIGKPLILKSRETCVNGLKADLRFVLGRLKQNLRSPDTDTAVSAFASNEFMLK